MGMKDQLKEYLLARIAECAKKTGKNERQICRAALDDAVWAQRVRDGGNFTIDKAEKLDEWLTANIVVPEQAQETASEG